MRTYYANLNHGNTQVWLEYGHETVQATYHIFGGDDADSLHTGNMRLIPESVEEAFIDTLYEAYREIGFSEQEASLASYESAQEALETAKII